MFRTRDEFARAAADFLRGGLDAGDRLIYVANREDEAALLHDLRPLGEPDDLRALLASGGLVVQAVREVYGPDEVVDPATQIAEYRRLTEQAEADGFSGISVAADATALVARPEARHQFMRYELAVDRYIAGFPMRAMCGYDADLLDGAELDMACVHRDCWCAHAEDGGQPGFAIWPGPHGVELAGEVDVSNVDRFRAALDAVLDAMPYARAAAGEDVPDPAHAPVVLDMRKVEFIDAEGASAVVSFGDGRGGGAGPVIVAEPPRSLRAIVETLGWGDRVVFARSTAGT